ncbi:E3 ubiquitin-protein ligase TRIM39-like [Salminus brasiliensis]|uniref:E3 ubiquitin-protein ligase TRIM39-like n=1 Tax=Salminus brasiliensis TaxID=930266 RepID=UPI003B83658F
MCMDLKLQKRFSCQRKMVFSKTDYSTGGYHSQGNLMIPNKRKQRTTNSEPFIKPNLSCVMQLADQLIEKILSQLIAKESVSLREDYKDMLKDLSKQWKKGYLVNFLPVMDFIIRTMLQDNMSEESIQKQWFKSQQMFKKAGGVYIPVPVWNWITRLQANVTLDPETANSNLLLSEDGKTVRTLTHEESKSSTFKERHRSCSKFDCWTFVQAVDGYTTGRHYWEVDVQRKCDWRIGVVKDSAPRRGFVNMNTTAGYWTLRLQLGSLMAMTDPVTRLNQPTPSRIGVYLDIEEGQISFYDSENRRHIYTFKTDFRSERIYPVFGTVETDRPIRIM